MSVVFPFSWLEVIDNHFQMWLIVPFFVPGGVATAKQNKTQKRKRCIFITGTVSKLNKKRRFLLLF
jgi:hypothetical protein